MKILHTADWHLGKRLDRFSRLEEQTLVMNEIAALADEHGVDLVLIAGDLFDSFNPGVEATELFYKTLKRLAKDGNRPVIAISGNHDSPNLIDAPDPLARECGIILIGHPKATVQPYELEHFKITKSVAGIFEIQIKNLDFPVRILHTAFANEKRLCEYLGEDKEDTLNQVLADHWRQVADEHCDKNGVNLMVTHLYMNKRGNALLEEPEGEKPLKIGNADLIYADIVPSQIQYTALGHLHAFRNIGTDEGPVVYSSSPLCYSFSEAGQTKYVSIVEVYPDKPASFQKVPLKNGKKLVRIKFDSIEKAVQWLSENPDTLVELTLESDTFLKAEDRKRLQQTHGGIIHLIPKIKNDPAGITPATEINLSQDTLPLFTDYFRSKNNGQEPNGELIELFNEILNHNA